MANELMDKWSEDQHTTTPAIGYLEQELEAVSDEMVKDFLENPAKDPPHVVAQKKREGELREKRRKEQEDSGK